MASGIIQLILLLLLVGLALLPFFQWFRGTPHQLAAIKELEQSLPDGLLDEEAAWFEAWKASGLDQEVRVPYFNQYDLGHEGYRMCFAATAAMAAANLGVIKAPKEYVEALNRFGDTTSVMAQLQTLRSLGLKAEFRMDGDADAIETEIESGRVVMVGYSHQGNLLRGEPPMCGQYACGHWSLIVGFEGKYSQSGERSWIVNDPAGKPLMMVGGHDRSRSGERVRISRQVFKERWEVDGPATGWYIVVDNE